MSDAGGSSPQMEGGAPGPNSGGSSRSQRRSARRYAQRRRRTGRLFLAVAPAAAVIAIIAVLFPLLASPGQGEEAGGVTTGPVAASGATATTVTASTSGATSPGNALLAIEQDGAAVALVLVSAGPNGGVVLGLPGVILLRSGDRFAQLAQLYGQDQQQAVVDAVADALAVPVGAVASVDWVDLRGALTNEGIEPPPPQLDAKDGDTATIAEALAAAFSKRGAGAGAPFWNELPLAGDVDRFRAAVGAALLAAEGTGWTGQAVTGTLVENDDLIYLEPDIKTARSVLTSTDMGG